MLENQTTPEKDRSAVVTIVIGVVVVATIGISLWALFKTSGNAPKPAVEINVPASMGPEELAHTQLLRIQNAALSSAENFLHQEVIILNADLINDGPRPLERLTVTVEFFDDMNQVVLRETRAVLGNPPSALGPGQTRRFQISFDQVPSSWNRQIPKVKLSQVQFASSK